MNGHCLAEHPRGQRVRLWGASALRGGRGAAGRWVRKVGGAFGVTCSWRGIMCKNWNPTWEADPGLTGLFGDVKGDPGIPRDTQVPQPELGCRGVRAEGGGADPALPGLLAGDPALFVFPFACSWI